MVSRGESKKGKCKVKRGREKESLDWFKILNKEQATEQHAMVDRRPSKDRENFQGLERCVVLGFYIEQSSNLKRLSFYPRFVCVSEFNLRN